MARRMVIAGGLILLLLAGMTFAQNTTFTVGGSWWNSKYDLVSTEDTNDKMEMGTGAMIGPYLSINNGKVNLGASLLMGTFDVSEGFWDGAELKRNDLNFTLGYRIISSSALNMNLFLGGKYLKFNVTGEASYVDEYYYEYTYDVDITQSGTMFGGGLSLMVPFGSSNLYGYGSLAYLTGTMTVEDNTTGESAENDEATNLVAMNAGLGYRFPGGFGVNAGYRADVFGSDAADYVDRLAGLILTASYTF